MVLGVAMGDDGANACAPDQRDVRSGSEGHRFQTVFLLPVSLFAALIADWFKRECARG